MAFLLPHSVFVHVPKTGGQWVVRAIENAGLLEGRLGPVHSSPDEIMNEAEFKIRPVVFAMVRHPLTWYQSMWAHRMDEEWSPIDDLNWFTPRWIDIWAEFTEHSRSNSFRDFVFNCANRFPGGFVSMLYDAYVEGCTFVGMQEHLLDDLIRILEMAGEEFDSESFHSVEPWNVRGRRKHRLSQCALTPELTELIIRVEAKAIKRFGYPEMPDYIEVTN